jgi:hypothetical protein
MDNNTQIETVEDKCKDVLNYLFPNNEGEMSCLQIKNSTGALKSIANWQKQQDEAYTQHLETTIKLWESKYKEILDSHNELLEKLKKTAEFGMDS